MSARLDTLLEQLAEQGDALEAAQAKLADLEAARARVAELRVSVGAVLAAIAEATGVVVGAPIVPALATGNAIFASQLNTAATPPPPADEDEDEDEEEEDEPPSVEPARSALFGGGPRRPMPHPQGKPAGWRPGGHVADDEDEDEPEDDDDQGDDEHGGVADDDEGEEQPAPKRATATGRGERSQGGNPLKAVAPKGIGGRVLEHLAKAKRPLNAADITKALREDAHSVQNALWGLGRAKRVHKDESVRPALWSLAKGAR